MILLCSSSASFFIRYIVSSENLKLIAFDFMFLIV
nr:MAG TPA: hypothetical protein [Caudoviricetes sp.]